MRRVMTPGNFWVFDPFMGPNLDQGHGPTWTRDGAQPESGTGPSLNYGWAQPEENGSALNRYKYRAQPEPGHFPMGLNDVGPLSLKNVCPWPLS